jgi:poly(hydroxyalkanoate) depolymerase family esterase
MKRLLTAVVGVLALATVALLASLTARLAVAATLTPVSGFGTNPSKLAMYVYVPAKLASRPALLVAVHHCTGSAQAFFSGAAHDYVTAADEYGYVILFPEATRDGHCFDVSTPQALKRDGGSDSTGIASMIRHAQRTYHTDPARTYLIGASSGAMMANVLAAEYPDLFAAATVFSGVPATCFGTGTTGSLWNGDCSGGKIVRTAREWADAARAMYPGYTGAYPRMQLWHGESDTVLGYPNLGEEIKQWTALHGLSQTPSSTDRPKDNWTRTRYGDTGARVAVEANRFADVGHDLPQAGQIRYSIDFLGLNDPGASAPTSAPTSTTTPVSSVLPCDIYAAGGTPCAAAHSTVRALFRSYEGPLYQVQRASDRVTKDLGLVDGGYADAAAQDSFCANTTCVITVIYDQSGRGNHLTQAPGGGAAPGPDNLADATRAPTTINGHEAYGVFVEPGTGYRSNRTSGIATGDQPEGMYAILDGTHYNGGCCFDYGNAETNSNDNGNGTMEAIYFGDNSWWGSGAGKGPWVMADLENGLFSGADPKHNANDPSITHRYLTAIVKGKPHQWAIRAGNAQSGELSTFYDGKRPDVPGYDPMHKEGAIILGIGGDNSNGAAGTFYEGVMTAGYPSDATENAVQANIVAAGYGSATAAPNPVPPPPGSSDGPTRPTSPGDDGG